MIKKGDEVVVTKCVGCVLTGVSLGARGVAKQDERFGEVLVNFGEYLDFTGYTEEGFYLEGTPYGFVVKKC